MKKQINKDTEKDVKMDFVEHLAELRKRLILVFIVFFVFFSAALFFVQDIYHFFELGINFELYYNSPGDIIWIFFTIAGIIALIGTIPILSLQLWLFIKPGLTKSERRVSLAYVPAVFILFIIGLVFGYLLFVNLIVPFLINLNAGMFVELFTVDKYFKFMFRMTLPFALLFEIPLVIMFLTSLGLVTPKSLKKTRKYSYFILLIVGALVTPPDIFMQLLVAIPLFTLYEISIYLSEIVYRRKRRRKES